MKDHKVYFAVASLLLIAYLVAGYNKPQPPDWTLTCRRTDTNPFGTYVLYNRLDDLFNSRLIEPAGDRPYNVLKTKMPASSSYILVAPAITLDHAELGELMSYTRRGGRVLVASNEIGPAMSKALKINIGSELLRTTDNYISLKFTSLSLKDRSFAFNKSIGLGYFRSFDTTRAAVLGTNSKGHANFIRYNFGRGALYLLPDPTLFTNYSLLYSHGSDYTAAVLSHLHSTGKVYWDTYFTHDTEEDDGSAMEVIFRYPPLKKGYLVATISLILFILVEIKRRQRIIPVIDPLKNATAEFVQVVGQVYFQQHNNRDIAQKNADQLMERIRSRFHLPTTELTQDFMEQLAAKSGAGMDLTSQMVSHVALIRSGKAMPDKELLRIIPVLDNFYKFL